MRVPIHRFLKEGVFDQEGITVMATAFEEALRELELTDRDDPLVEIVAKMIIECARKGSFDVAFMRDCALNEIRNPPKTSS